VQGNSVLVTGTGTMGLLAVFVLRSLGIEQIDVVEPATDRRALALRLGASRCDWPRAAGAGYDAGIECSASDAAFALLQNTVRAGGRICVLSDGNLEPMTLTPAFHEKELSIVASSDGEDYRGHVRWYFEQAPRFQHTPALLFQHEITSAQLPETFERLATGDIAPVKVLVRYRGRTTGDTGRWS
jgi:alcohol dehydrogenase